MKASELRLNNLVFYDGKPRIVTHIDKDHVGLLIEGTEFTESVTRKIWSDLSPIPLDESWLTRLGFELKWRSDTGGKGGTPTGIYFKKMKFPTDLEHDFYHQIEINTGLPMESPLFCMVGIYNKSEMNSNHNFAWVKYVHQLQNAIFASTGEELSFAEVGESSSHPPAAGLSLDDNS